MSNQKMRNTIVKANFIKSTFPNGEIQEIELKDNNEEELKESIELLKNMVWAYESTLKNYEHKKFGVIKK